MNGGFSQAAAVLLNRPQVFGGHSAVFARRQVVFQHLPVFQSADARFVYGGNVDEYVL